MRVDWCVSSWFRIKNTHSLTHSRLAVMCVYVCVCALFPSGGAILRGRSEVGCKMNKTRYRTLTTYVSHLSSPPTHISTHDTLETMDVSLAPSYNLHIAHTGDSSYLPSISLLSLSTISTTDRKRRQRERPRLPTQKSSSRSSAFHSAASPADLLTFQPRSMRPRQSPSRPSVPRSPSITRRAPSGGLCPRC